MSKKILTLLLLLILTVIVIVFIVFLLFFSKKSGEKKQSVQINPPITITAPPTSAKTQLLSITKIVPEQDLTKEYNPITQLSIIFNMPVNPEGFFYTVDPFVKTNTRSGKDSNTIIISANHWWNEGKDGITTITVLQNTRSASGIYLEKPVVYKIKTAFPKGGV